MKLLRNRSGVSKVETLTEQFRRMTEKVQQGRSDTAPAAPDNTAASLTFQRSEMNAVPKPSSSPARFPQRNRAARE